MAVECQDGRNEKRDLQAGADRDTDGQIHLVFHRHEDGGRVLGRVAHNRHHNHTDKHLGEADGIPNAFDRPDEKLRKQGDKGGSDEQDDNSLTARPSPLCFFVFLNASEEILVGPEREPQHAEVGQEHHHGDA